MGMGRQRLPVWETFHMHMDRARCPCVMTDPAPISRLDVAVLMQHQHKRFCVVRVGHREESPVRCVS